MTSHYITLHHVFLQLLGSHDVGLKLTDDELHQVVSFLDPDSSGWVPYFESSTSIREILLAIYSARAVEKRVSGGGEKVGGEGKGGGGGEWEWEAGEWE